MSHRFAPESILPLVVDSFTDPKRPAYAQIATVDRDSHAQVRTVHVHYLWDLHQLAFNAHARSAKWAHVKKSPAVSGCYFDTYRNVQFRWTGSIELVEKGKSPHDSVLETMWRLTREEVRLAYWLDEKKRPLISEHIDDIDVREIAPSFVTAICQPLTWDLYELHPEEYRLGKRSIHEFKNGVWSSKTASILHGN